jgi:hypothetical protein
MLGWTSKPEIYITGLRVMRGAEIVLRTRGFGRHDFDAASIRAKLEALADTAEKSQLHERWLLWIEAALQCEVSSS